MLLLNRSVFLKFPTYSLTLTHTQSTVKLLSNLMHNLGKLNLHLSDTAAVVKRNVKSDIPRCEHGGHYLSSVGKGADKKQDHAGGG